MPSEGTFQKLLRLFRYIVMASTSQLHGVTLTKPHHTRKDSIAGPQKLCMPFTQFMEQVLPTKQSLRVCQDWVSCIDQRRPKLTWEIKYVLKFLSKTLQKSLLTSSNTTSSTLKLSKYLNPHKVVSFTPRRHYKRFLPCRRGRVCCYH